MNQYKNDIFSSKRINDEMSNEKQEQQEEIPIRSVYSYMEIRPAPKEPVVENRDELPEFTEIVGDTENKTFPKILELIIKFYAKVGINIAIKFNDFYEFQKAYALLLGVLHKVGYNSYRASIAMRKAIANVHHIKKLIHVKMVSQAIKTYVIEHKKFNEIKKLN